MVSNFGLVKEIDIRKDYKSTCSITIETSENQEQCSGLQTTVGMQCVEADVESPAEEDEVQNLEKIPIVGENTEESSNESEDVEKTTDEGQVVNVEDTTTRGKYKNVDRTNNENIEAIKESKSESGAQTAKEGQETFIEEDTPNEEEIESLEDTSSEGDSDSAEETTSEDEDEAIRKIIIQENRVDMNEIVTYYGRDNYQLLNFVGMIPVEESSSEMTPTETNSGNIKHECVNKENSITVSPMTMAINVQKSQPTPEVKKKPGRSRTSVI